MHLYILLYVYAQRVNFYKKLSEIIVTIFLLIHAIHPWIIVLYRG